MKLSIATVIGGTLSKKKKKVKILTPTHTVEAESVTCPTEGVRFPCTLRDGQLKIGDIVKVDWEEEGMEEFVVTKIENTPNQHLQVFNIKV